MCLVTIEYAQYLEIVETRVVQSMILLLKLMLADIVPDFCNLYSNKKPILGYKDPHDILFNFENKSIYI